MWLRMQCINALKSLYLCALAEKNIDLKVNRFGNLWCTVFNKIVIVKKY